MELSLTCGPCGTVITADGEDALVDAVQTHAREHDGADLSREHILAHLRGEDPDDEPPINRTSAAAQAAQAEQGRG